MRTTRWLELVSALTGAAVASFQLYHIVFDPVCCVRTDNGPVEMVSLWQQGDPSTIQSIGFVTAVFLIALVCAVAHSLTGNPIVRRVLWIAAVILIVYSLLEFLTIGLQLLPAALLMLIAALLPLRRHATASQ